MHYVERLLITVTQSYLLLLEVKFVKGKQKTLPDFPTKRGINLIFTPYLAFDLTCRHYYHKMNMLSMPFLINYPTHHTSEEIKKIDSSQYNQISIFFEFITFRFKNHQKIEHAFYVVRIFNLLLFFFLATNVASFFLILKFNSYIQKIKTQLHINLRFNFN